MLAVWPRQLKPWAIDDIVRVDICGWDLHLVIGLVSQYKSHTLWYGSVKEGMPVASASIKHDVGTKKLIKKRRRWERMEDKARWGKSSAISPLKFPKHLFCLNIPGSNLSYSTPDENQTRPIRSSREKL
ncbi:hypothetical protein PoB_001235900 [Plakobranchus ocellatus]|uniref:Uncharacterized protein n=1 Tax=Plakobranchus ocellatus TaxID=259542 RepID=A0AAV3YVU4_9GAST|nr:hypothetical protein PoB_001235900 [Plakobranchus ocellatus]